MSLSHDKRESTVGAGREMEGEECSSRSGCLNQKNQQGARIQSSRRGWGSSGTANGLVSAPSLSLYRSRLWHERRLNGLDTLESPTDSLRRQKEPSELWSLFYILIEVNVQYVQSVWRKIGTSYVIHLPSVCPCLPLFHCSVTPATRYGYNPFALLALRKMQSETLCREEGCTYNNSVIGTTQSATSVPLARLPDAFSTY